MDKILRWYIQQAIESLEETASDDLIDLIIRASGRKSILLIALKLAVKDVG